MAPGMCVGTQRLPISYTATAKREQILDRLPKTATVFGSLTARWEPSEDGIDGRECAATVGETGGSRITKQPDHNPKLKLKVGGMVDDGSTTNRPTLSSASSVKYMFPSLP